MTERSELERPRLSTYQVPAQEKEQPDPMLQITTRRVGGMAAALLTVAAVFILWVVLYGLNEPGGSSAALPANHPAAPGNSSAVSPTAPQNGPHNSGSGAPAASQAGPQNP